eukprot:9982711-Alexandrium_andersonii.AAC.1
MAPDLPGLRFLEEPQSGPPGPFGAWRAGLQEALPRKPGTICWLFAPQSPRIARIADGGLADCGL